MERSDTQKCPPQYVRVHMATHLNKELGLDLDVYDYDGRSDHARFACDTKSQEWETNYILKKLGQ